MDDVVDRNVPFADENIEPNARPAHNKFGNWADGVSKTIHNHSEDTKDLSDEEREKRISEMDSIIKKELE